MKGNPIRRHVSQEAHRHGGGTAVVSMSGVLAVCLQRASQDQRLMVGGSEAMLAAEKDGKAHSK